MIKALMHINSILQVVNFKLKMFSKLQNLNYESSEEQLCQSYFQFIESFMEIHPRIKSALQAHESDFMCIKWDSLSQIIIV